jgi:hypothetical protein
MTAQTPATKAGGLSALLASFSPKAAWPKPVVKQDFLSVILKALTHRAPKADAGTAAQPSSEKPSLPPGASADGAAADAIADAAATSLLLCLLAPPLPLPPQLPVLAKPTANKSTVSTVPSAPLAQSAAETKPAKTDAGEKPPALAAQLAPADIGPEKKAAQPITGKALPLPAQPAPAKPAAAKAAPSSGTSVALSSERMNYMAQRDEIAGPTEQKLPSAAVSAINGANPGSGIAGGAKSPLTFSWHETPSEEVEIAVLSAEAAGPAAPPADAAPAAAPVTAPLDRLEQMIFREVVSFRQAGAQTLGVTLKVDAHTQLFLQLTSSNGQVQASVRCDRGSFSAPDTQWAQLEQSLARQNVQLLPLDGALRLGFEQSPDHSQRHFAAAIQNVPPAGAAVEPAQARKQNGQNRSRKNWESWA